LYYRYPNESAKVNEIFKQFNTEDKTTSLKTLNQILHDALNPTEQDLLAMEVHEKRDGKNRKLRKVYIDKQFWIRVEGNFIDTAYKYGYERKYAC
jgi:hypothetical protein